MLLSFFSFLFLVVVVAVAVVVSTCFCMWLFHVAACCDVGSLVNGAIALCFLCQLLAANVRQCGIRAMYPLVASPSVDDAS